MLSVDKIGRVSYARQVSVKRVAPDQVKVEAGYSCEKYVYGKVPNVTKKSYVIVKIGKKSYGAYSDKDGYYAVKTAKLEKGMSIKVYAKDKKSSKQQSYAKSMKVSDITGAYKKYKNLSVKAKKITAKDRVLSGSSKNYYGYKVCAASEVSSDYAKIDKMGEFKIKLTKKQPGKSYIYIVIRDKLGRIKAVNRKFVVELPPSKPKFKGRPRANDDTVTVVTNRKFTVKIKVGKRVYRKSKLTYNAKAKNYRYVFTVRKLKKGQEVTAYATNTGGTAKSGTVEVLEAVKAAKKPGAVKKSGTNKKK